jgi:hypothetical protein
MWVRSISSNRIPYFLYSLYMVIDMFNKFIYYCVVVVGTMAVIATATIVWVILLGDTIT